MAVLLYVVLLSLSSCCVGRVINTRDAVAEEFNERELDMVVKELYAKLMEKRNGIQTTTLSIPTTTSKQQQQPGTDLYIQHIVNCYKYYQIVTEQGLNERDDIYNIVNAQCMTDPEVARIVKLLTTYRLSENVQSGKGHNFSKRKMSDDFSTWLPP
ncbi:uncharacterized protein [Antedon mediterranea]|uniref:uncharacterized protein n=1 Tax=Antedon mediterranea TaxID=105859 RepID=UPI003AF41F51